ncbi:MAG: 50S ribosomal protein L29 [Rhodothermales bacterium]
MKAKEIRDLGTAEIEQRLQEETTELSQLEFQHAVADLEDPMVLRRKRRLIARLRTILSEKAA